ncbi:hypothetical protein FACS1894191_6470 [Clostridia bacterium]|nr:hypothetical protein FACS1894191_6470 [Clostridia bacterium]
MEVATKSASAERIPAYLNSPFFMEKPPKILVYTIIITLTEKEQALNRLAVISWALIVIIQIKSLPVTMKRVSVYTL